MNEEPRGIPEKTKLSDVEGQLRRLPAPAPPSDLERRLLAGIPEIKVCRPKRRRRAVWVYAFAASVAAALAIWVGMIRHEKIPAPTGGALHTIAALNNTTPRFVLKMTTSPNYQETRPCDILPPLPFSR